MSPERFVKGESERTLSLSPAMTYKFGVCPNGEPTNVQQKDGGLSNRSKQTKHEYL